VSPSFKKKPGCVERNPGMQARKSAPVASRNNKRRSDKRKMNSAGAGTDLVVRGQKKDDRRKQPMGHLTVLFG
jgi:hypothetical protein